MKFKAAFVIFLFLVLGFIIFFFIGFPEKEEDILWGVSFSEKHSSQMGLDWKKNYSSLLDDLNIKRIKVAAHWDLLEPEKDEFFFDNLDWQIEEAKKRGAKVLLVIGLKTPRWPECHLPEWALSLD